VSRTPVRVIIRTGLREQDILSDQFVGIEPGLTTQLQLGHIMKDGTFLPALSQGYDRRSGPLMLEITTAIDPGTPVLDSLMPGDHHHHGHGLPICSDPHEHARGVVALPPSIAALMGALLDRFNPLDEQLDGPVNLDTYASTGVEVGPGDTQIIPRFAGPPATTEAVVVAPGACAHSMWAEGRCLGCGLTEDSPDPAVDATITAADLAAEKAAEAFRAARGER